MAGESGESGERDIPDNPSVNVRLAHTGEVGRPGLRTDLAQPRPASSREIVPLPAVSQLEPGLENVSTMWEMSLCSALTVQVTKTIIMTFDILEMSIKESLSIKLVGHSLL